MTCKINLIFISINECLYNDENQTHVGISVRNQLNLQAMKMSTDNVNTLDVRNVFVSVLICVNHTLHTLRRKFKYIPRIEYICNITVDLMLLQQDMNDVGLGITDKYQTSNVILFIQHAIHFYCRLLSSFDQTVTCCWLCS